jgi:hypothetical protein
MTLEELPANPMQPYIDHIRAMGVEGRIAVWCSAQEDAAGRPTQYWTAFVGREQQQFSAYSTFGNLVQAISVKYLSQFAADPVAMGY